MITASLRMIAKALQGATRRVFRMALVLTIPLALTAGAQVITKDALKAAAKQIDAAKSEQKDATKFLDKSQKAAKEALADLDAAKQHLAALQEQLAKAPADAKAKLATKVQAAKGEVAELDTAKAKADTNVTAARQRLTTANEKVLAAEGSARTLNSKFADQKLAAPKAAEQKAVAKVEPAKPVAAVAAAPKPAVAAPAPKAAAPAAVVQTLQPPVAGTIVIPTSTPKLTGTETPPLPAVEAPKPVVAAPVKTAVAAPATKAEPVKPAVAVPTPKAEPAKPAVAAPAPKPVALAPAPKPAAPAPVQAALQPPASGTIVTPVATPKLTGTETAPLPAAPAPKIATPAATVAAPAKAEPVKPTAVAAAPKAEVKPAKTEPKPAKPVAKPTPKVTAEQVAGPFQWGELRPAQPTPTIAGEQKITVEPSAIPPLPVPAAADKIQFDVAMVSGDKAIVEKLDAWKEWNEHITFNPVSVKEIQEFHAKLMKALAQEGYVFANVTFPTRVWNNGIFLAKVDGGPLGNITSVKGNRYYSASQIVKNLSRTGMDRFDYTSVYGDLFDLNAKPDLQVNMKLKPIIQDGRRVMNADLEVEDKLPIHGAFEVSNTGTKQTNDWRLHSTISHLNLTKHDDVLTLDWITSPDLEDVNAWSGGYFLPIDREYSLSLFGGYSDSDLDDVMPMLDVRGKGYFGGGQVTKTYKEDAKRRIQLSAGWLYQRFQDTNEVNGLVLDDRDVAVSMPNFTVGYVTKQLDKWHGKNFFSNTIMANFSGKFGSSEDEDFNAQGHGFTQGDFIIDKFQFVRFQRLFKGDDQPGKWTLMFKVDGQLASDPLIAGLRRSLGGADSVRGYHEQEAAFDEAYVATLELHTPLMQNFIPGLKKSDEFLSSNPEAWQQHRLLFLVFADYGYGKNLEPLPDELANDSIVSVGAGLRLGITKYANLRLDYGFPLTETEETSSKKGRAHVSFQLQF